MNCNTKKDNKVTKSIMTTVPNSEEYLAEEELILWCMDNNVWRIIFKDMTDAEIEEKNNVPITDTRITRVEEL